MADKILYTNKEKLLDDITIPDKNKVTANDMNEIKEVVNAHADDIGLLETNKADRTEIPTDLSELSNETTKFVNETQLANAILEEKTERQTADNNLQTQIDGIVAQSDVVDIIGTYQELLNYDTSKLTENDIIKVLSDSTHNNATSYYRWENNSWDYVGSEGPYYTKGETDERLNQKADKSSLNQTNQNVSALSGRVGTNESDVRDIKAEQITQNTQIAILVADSGNKIELSVNSTNYVMTATLKNKAGEILNTSSIDLPIEAMIINARYDSATKELVLTLQNGNTIRVSIADIIDGLVSQSDFDDLVVRVEDIEEEQETQNESIEELQEQVEILTNTVESELEDTTATGESITVNDSANAPAKLLPSGNTYQAQYKGYNLLNVADRIFNTTGSDQYLFQNFALDNTKSYKLKMDYEYINAEFSSSGGVIMAKKDSNYSSLKSSSADAKGSISSDITGTSQLSVYVTTRLSAGQVKLSNVMLYEGTEEKTYEPYTDGKVVPNPEQESTIHNVSGHNEFKVQNKNWLEYTLTYLKEKNTNGTWNGNVYTYHDVTYTINEDLSITVNGTASNATYLWLRSQGSGLDLVQGETYMLGGCPSGGGNTRYSLRIYTTGLASYTAEIGDGYTFAHSNEVAVRINVAGGTTCNNVLFKPQIEKGSVKTDWILHEEQIRNLNLPAGMEMCKISNYADKFVKQDGKWYKQAKVIKLTPSTWSKIGTTNYYFMSGINTTNVKVGIGNIKPNILCNMYQAVTPNNVYHINGDIQQGVSLISSGIIVRDVNVTTVDDFKELTNNLVVYAIYNTPVLTEITDTTLIQQLDSFQNVMSYFGQTNADTISAGDLEPILNFEYKKSNRLRIDALEQAIISLGGNI